MGRLNPRAPSIGGISLLNKLTITILSTISTTAIIPTMANSTVTPLPPTPTNEYRSLLLTDTRRTIVTNQAMGARCAVSADFDGDGLPDIVAASSNDNAVSWFRNLGPETDPLTGLVLNDGLPKFSIKKQITWSSLGSRIVTVADINSDGIIDVIGASYYDSSLRWYENDGNGVFTPHLISTAVNEGQGVTVADVNNDGTVDIISASSGDNTIAVFRNIDGNGTFCELKEVVDDDAIGARTAVAADLNGDGWVDIASASKDDDTVAWYPNDGTGHFPTKIVISKGEFSKGAYSLVAKDVDQDGTIDLVVASNGNDSVTLWKNVDGNGNFTRTLIYDQADFVLSVTAVDFDRDGDIDVASASFFDGKIIWYENVDGKGNVWQNHTIYQGIQGHYVSHGDMDGDGDDDLIAVTHAENTVAIYFARTGCDFDEGDNATEGKATQEGCCKVGTQWNAETMACEACAFGEYGVGSSGAEATCVACPTDACLIEGHHVLPSTCSGITGCVDVDFSTAECSCPANFVRDMETDTCTACPEGQVRSDTGLRSTATLGKYALWVEEQGVCVVAPQESSNNALLIGVIVGLIGLILIGLVAVWYFRRNSQESDDVWKVLPSELTFSEPPKILGRGTFGLVVLAEYRGTEVAVKRVIPPKAQNASVTDSVITSNPLAMLKKRSTMNGGRRSSCASDVDDQMSNRNLVNNDGSNEANNLVHHRTMSTGSLPSVSETPTGKEKVKQRPSVFDDEEDLETGGADGTATILIKSTYQSTMGKTGSKSMKKGVGLISFFDAYSKESKRDCDVTTHAKLKEDFVREMRHLSKLRHPCITTVMGAIIEDQTEPALVMEYMDRGSLHDLLHNETFAIDGGVLLPILQDICKGLRFLHCADPSVIHGDLKSANILIDNKFRAKIADFGLTQKKAMGVAGTPYWMSPELLRGESGNTTMSDIYSMGIILYEVYSRKNPYEEDDNANFKQILRDICDCNINKRPPVPSACPDTIGVIMRECFDAKPSARPSAEELDMRMRREKIENIEPGDMRLTVQEKKNSKDFLDEMFPKHIAQSMREGKKVEPEQHDCVTVFFSDIVSFTRISGEIGHKKVCRMLDKVYTEFDMLVEKHGLFKIDVIGDAYLAVTNLAQDQKDDHVKRIAEFSIDAMNAAHDVLIDEDDPTKGGVQIRVGFHTGPVVSDVLGTRLPKYSIFGDTVNTASRMESHSLPGRIQCSSTSASLLAQQAPDILQVSRGHIHIKGKGEMHTFWVDFDDIPRDNGNIEQEKNNDEA